MNLLAEWKVSKAVSSIAKHAEDQQHSSLLEQTYVDAGALLQISNRNSQIVQGRRGTGKSHLLRVASAAFDREPRQATVYLDVRRLGSAQLMTDPSQPLKVRCVTLFRDLLSAIQECLLDLAVNQEESDGLEAVSAFADVVLARSTQVSERKITSERSDSRKSGFSMNANVGPGKTQLGGGLSGEDVVSGKQTEAYTEVLSDTVVFAEVGRSLETAVAVLGIDLLTVLIDEWATIPLDVQPYMAEFLKRTVLPSSRLAVKIAVLEHRTRFWVKTATGDRVGLEVGGDISGGVDLDDYYVYDRSPRHVTTIFSELLYRHLSAELPDRYLSETFGIHDSEGLVAALFADEAALIATVRAGEGVARDFIGVFTAAYFRSVREGATSVDEAAVERASRSWFETDKFANLDNDLTGALIEIVRQVVDGANSRFFLLDRADGGNATIQTLYDQRVLHLVQRAWLRPADGRLWDVYSIDHGAVRSLSSNGEVGGAFEEDAALPVLTLEERNG
jgi:hypothetical protein